MCRQTLFRHLLGSIKLYENVVTACYTANNPRCITNETRVPDKRELNQRPDLSCVLSCTNWTHEVWT